MDVNRRWTVFAADAEVDAFGTRRLVAAHNATIDRAEKAEAEVARLDRYICAVESTVVPISSEEAP